MSPPAWSMTAHMLACSHVLGCSGLRSPSPVMVDRKTGGRSPRSQRRCRCMAPRQVSGHIVCVPCTVPNCLSCLGSWLVASGPRSANISGEHLRALAGCQVMRYPELKPLVGDGKPDPLEEWDRPSCVQLLGTFHSIPSGATAT